MLLKGRISIWDFVKTIKFDVISITIFSVVVGGLAEGKYFHALVIPLGLVAVVGTAISLLLAFRTGQSYDRWWEARSIWGAIVNDSRTLLRQLQCFLPDAAAAEIRLMAERQIIWTFALGQSLRQTAFSPRVQAYIHKYDIQDNNIPNALLVLHSQQLKNFAEKGALTEFRQVQLDTTVARLCDAMGKCERIKGTVFPVSYGTLIHFLIYLFALLLPFSLEDTYPIVKALLTAGIPIIFIIIEKTAILMQDPFENGPMDTPMTHISLHIEAVLLQQLGEAVEWPLPPDEKFYYLL